MQDDYFPELFKEEAAPKRIPMREAFYSTEKEKNFDHFRIPWETAAEWNARKRGWPCDDESDDESDDERGDESGDESGAETGDENGDEGGNDRHGVEMDQISLFSVEEPASDADGAGHEWAIDTEAAMELKGVREYWEESWAAEAEETQEDDAQAKKKAVKEMRNTLWEKSGEQREKVVSRPAKRGKLASTSDKAAQRKETHADKKKTKTERES